jgi:ABC-type branched-subunit amino acid transport system ATPase component
MKTATTNLLEFDGISKSFDHVRALQDISLVVGHDEIVGLLGDNGAGKSTLIKIITGFRAPDGGTISWKGEQIDHLSVNLRDVRRRLRDRRDRAGDRLARLDRCAHAGDLWRRDRRRADHAGVA